MLLETDILSRIHQSLHIAAVGEMSWCGLWKILLPQQRLELDETPCLFLQERMFSMFTLCILNNNKPVF